MIRIIVAVDKNMLIGTKETYNGIPWDNKEDLKHYRETTLNKTVLFGKNTYLAIGRPLPKRTNIVVCLDGLDDEYDNLIVSNDLMEVIVDYKRRKEDLYICGGASIYAQALPYADEMIMSVIDGDYVGDTYFPEFKQYGYKLVAEERKDTFTLQTYRRG